jgi:hypothetical protein
MAWRRKHSTSLKALLKYLEPKALNLAEQWINQRRAEWAQHFDQLGEYLNTLVKERGTHAKDK